MNDIKDYLIKHRILVLTLILLSIHLIYLGLQSYQMDFRACYVAVQSFINGLNPFNNNIVNDMIYADGFHLGSVSRFVYPPIVVILFMPFGIISQYYLAKGFFTVLSILALIILLLFLHKKYPIKNEYVILSFLSLPVFTNIERGQVYIIMTLMLVLSYFYRKHLWSGLLLALTIHLRIIPVLLLFYFLAKKQYKIIYSTIGFSVLIFFISLVFFDVSHYFNFIRNFLALDQNITLANAKELFFSPEFPKTIDGLSINSNAGNYFFSQFVYFQNPEINFLAVIFTKNIIPLFSLIAIAAYALYVRKQEDNDFHYYAFMLLILSFSSISYIYAMVFYLPFYFAMLHKYQDKFLYSIILSLPLFIPVQISINNTNISYFLAIVLILFFSIKQAKANGKFLENPIKKSSC